MVKMYFESQLNIQTEKDIIKAIDRIYWYFNRKNQGYRVVSWVTPEKLSLILYDYYCGKTLWKACEKYNITIRSRYLKICEIIKRLNIKKSPKKSIDEPTIVNLYKKSYHIKDISQKIKIDRHTIIRILIKNGLYNPLDKHTVDKILRLYNHGSSITKVAKKTGVGRHVISGYVEYYNCKRSKQEVYYLRDNTHRRIPIIDDYFENINSPRKAITLGLLYADGWITYNKVCFEVTERDRMLVEYVRNELSPARSIQFKKGVKKHVICNKRCSTKPTYKIQIPSPRLVTCLQEKHGFTSDKSYQNNTQFLRYISVKYMWAFLYGIFLGDGWNSEHNIGLMTGLNIELMSYVRDFLKKQNISALVQHVSGSDSYQLVSNWNNALKILQKFIPYRTYVMLPRKFGCKNELCNSLICTYYVDKFKEVIPCKYSSSLNILSQQTIEELQ